MKVHLKGSVIGAEKTQTGKNIVVVLTPPHEQTKAQETFKVMTKEPHPIGAKFDAVVRSNVEIWFQE